MWPNLSSICLHVNPMELNQSCVCVRVCASEGRIWPLILKLYSYHTCMFMYMGQIQTHWSQWKGFHWHLSAFDQSHSILESTKINSSLTYRNFILPLKSLILASDMHIQPPLIRMVITLVCLTAESDMGLKCFGNCLFSLVTFLGLCVYKVPWTEYL